MCAAARLAHVFRCCVTSHPPARQTLVADAAWTTSLAADDQHVAPAANTAWPTTSMSCRSDRHCTYVTVDVDDPSTPVPVCCCERCDGGWFPPEVSLPMRSCLLACDVDHVTLCDSRRCHCTWTGDVICLDDNEKSEMSVMTRDFEGVDLLVCIHLPSRRSCSLERCKRKETAIEGIPWQSVPLYNAIANTNCIGTGPRTRTRRSP